MKTLERILEPEVMDTPEEAASYDAMDHAAVNRLFVEDLLVAQRAHAEITERWEVVDLGCGTAQLPIILCENVEQAFVLAADLSKEMLELARYNIEAAGLTERIQLVHSDAKRADFGDDAVDAVISNSIVHHIPEPKSVLEEAVRIVKPGGLLFFRDLMRPANQTELDNLVATYAAGESDHARELFRDSLHAALSLNEIQDLVEACGFPRQSVAATSDRHWTWAAPKR